MCVQVYLAEVTGIPGFGNQTMEVAVKQLRRKNSLTHVTVLCFTVSFPFPVIVYSSYEKLSNFDFMTNSYCFYWLRKLAVDPPLPSPPIILPPSLHLFPSLFLSPSLPPPLSLSSE